MGTHTGNAISVLARYAAALSGAKAGDVHSTRPLGTTGLCPGIVQARFRVAGVIPKSHSGTVDVIITYFPREGQDPELCEVLLRYPDDGLANETGHIGHLVQVFKGEKILTACDWGHFAPDVRGDVPSGTFYIVKGTDLERDGTHPRKLVVMKSGGRVTNVPPTNAHDRRYTYGTDPRDMISAYRKACAELVAVEAFIAVENL